VTPDRLGTYVAGGRGLRAPKEEWARDAADAKRLGMGVARFNADAWDILEPRPGVYDWRSLDRAVEALSAENVEILFTLPISNSRNSPRRGPVKVNGTLRVHGRFVKAEGIVGPTHFPARDTEEIKRLARAVAERYKGRIRTYEVWNEPDFALFWKGAPDAAEYAALLKAVSPEIRAADPGARILMGGLAFPAESEWFDRFLAEGAAPFFDAVNIHVYPAYSTLDAALANVRAVMAARGVSKPVWITETSSTGGYFDSRDREAEERKKAAYLTETYAQALSEPGVEKIFWHTLRNPGRDAGMPRDFDFGLMTGGGAPLPALQAYRTMADRLLGTVPKGREKADPRIRLYAFSKDRGTVYVGWSSDGDAEYRLRSPGFRARRVDMFGTARDLGSADDLAVTMGPVPFYIELVPARKAPAPPRKGRR